MTVLFSSLLKSVGTYSYTWCVYDCCVFLAFKESTNVFEQDIRRAHHVLMTSNFWATELGFDREDKLTSHAQADHNTLAVSHAIEPPLPNEVADLEDWMTTFHRRMEQREQNIAKAHTNQLHRDDEEIEKWKLVRDLDEAELIRKNEQHKLELQEAAEAQLREEEAHREHGRVMLATKGMTDDDRESWLADERELELLQSKEAAQHSRLEALNAVLMKSVVYLAEKEGAELEESRRLEELRSLELESALREKADERLLFDTFEGNERLAILSVEPLDRNMLEVAFRESLQGVVGAARAKLLNCLDSSSRARLQSLPDNDANAILDDLVLLSDMQRTVDKITSR
jgi:hypothetical protein